MHNVHTTAPRPSLALTAVDRWLEGLYEAHCEGAHGDDTSGYWHKAGCHGCTGNHFARRLA